MLCVIAVFIPAFSMTGAAKALFTPLALAVGFSMLASYLLSSTLVPVLAVWFLRPLESGGHASASRAEDQKRRGFAAWQARYARGTAVAVRFRWALLGGGFFGSRAAGWLVGRGV